MSEDLSPQRKSIDSINAKYGKGEDYTYKHDAGETVYVFVEAGAAKCRIDGTWYVAVFYRGENGMLCCTSAERWRMRFKRTKGASM